MPLALLFLAALLHGVRRLWSARASAAAKWATAGTASWLAYSILGVAYSWWYMVVPLAGLATVAAAGFGDAVRGRLVPALCIVVFIGSWFMGLQLYVGRAQTEYRSFMTVAAELRARARPGETVLLEPIRYDRVGDAAAHHRRGWPGDARCRAPACRWPRGGTRTSFATGPQNGCGPPGNVPGFQRLCGPRRPISRRG